MHAEDEKRDGIVNLYIVHHVVHKLWVCVPIALQKTSPKLMEHCLISYKINLLMPWHIYPLNNLLYHSFKQFIHPPSADFFCFMSAAKCFLPAIFPAPVFFWFIQHYKKNIHPTLFLLFLAISFLPYYVATIISPFISM